MIPKLTFGRTGHESTRLLFGAAALGSVTQDEADKVLDLLLQYGINHIDTAASYGESEDRIGKWMRDGHRDKFFLATKTGDRIYQGARDSIHRSLERLSVDQIDLIQLHYLVDPQEWEIAMGDGGALEACIEARDQGLVRYIGVTGHDITIAQMHKRSLERFDFDSVLLPYSFVMMQNPQYAVEFDTLFAMCRERNVAVQTIKTITRTPWAEGAHRHAATWYQPLTDQKPIDHAVHWAMGNPHVFLNTVGDIHILPKVLDAATRFTERPSDEVMQADAVQYSMSPLFT